MVGVAEVSQAPASATNGKAAAPAEPAPPRTYVKYDDVHFSIERSFETLKEGGFATPDYLVAISGGGLIPARILRSILRHNAPARKGSVAAIKVIGLELYDDDLDGKERETGVIRTQWLDFSCTSDPTPLAGKTILVVDEVDDSRQTLAFACRELLDDIRKQEDKAEARTGVRPATRLGVFVIHNKARPKKGALPSGVPQFVAEEVNGTAWIVYPWDAVDIREHNGMSVS